MNRQRRTQVAENHSASSWVDWLIAIWALLSVIGFTCFIIAVSNGLPIAMELCAVGRYVYVTVVAICIIGLALRGACVLKGQSKE